ncbi:MAG: glycosyltransferase [Chloroflexi bacterium]|nr:glycosyltransferase [Chloroflexota bacterium]
MTDRVVLTPRAVPSVSIVIPCYDEEANLRAGVLDRVAAYVESHDFCREVLVVDDGSDDASAALVDAFAAAHPRFRLLREPHRGKAGAVIAGVLAATADYVLFCDMDQATPVADLDRLVPSLLDSYDVVVGSRAQQRAGAPLVRKLMAHGFTELRRLIVDVGGIADTQCGFKCFRRCVVHTLCSALRVYRSGAPPVRGATVTAAFDVELLYLAHRMGCRMAEVPVRWQYVGTRRVDPVRESWRGLRGLLTIRLNDLLGRYRAISLASKDAALE